MLESGLSTYFNQGKIRIRFKTIEEMGHPDYIRFRINEKKKHLFIEKCSRCIESFRIEYQSDKKVKEQSCYINTKRLLEYLAAVIGVPADSPSLRFKGKMQADGTFFVDLSQYTVISHEKEDQYTTAECREKG